MAWASKPAPGPSLFWVQARCPACLRRGNFFKCGNSVATREQPGSGAQLAAPGCRCHVSLSEPSLDVRGLHLLCVHLTVPFSLGLWCGERQVIREPAGNATTAESPLPQLLCAPRLGGLPAQHTLIPSDPALPDSKCEHLEVPKHCRSSKGLS